MVERKPSLTRIVNGKVAGGGERGRHESVSGLIEGRPSGETVRRERRELVRARTLRNQTRAEPEPGEEDRPNFWSKRQVVPTYNVEKGDPRK
jgi:hypothetical protein